MNTVVRNVGEIDACDRKAVEHVVGQRLRETQQLVIGIVDLCAPVQRPSFAPNETPKLPEWCNVYAGLTDEEISEMEKAILQRADLSRASE